jgi:hypothetical protein
MTSNEMLDEELEEELDEGVTVNELRLLIHPLDSLRDCAILTGRQLTEQVLFWFENYDQMWEKHNTEFIFDHLVRDMTKLGVDYRSQFIADTTDFFTVIAKDSGEQGGATLNKVWSERRDDASVSVVHHARELVYGWLNQREKLPGRQTLATHVHNYFTVQHTFMKKLHWTALVLSSLKQYWSTDIRCQRIDELLAQLYALNFSIRNPRRGFELAEITQQLQTL